MVRKSIVLIIMAISFLGCDSDFEQGDCDDGFYQQNDGNGGYFCAPITEEGTIDDSMPESNSL